MLPFEGLGHRDALSKSLTIILLGMQIRAPSPELRQINTQALFCPMEDMTDQQEMRVSSFARHLPMKHATRTLLRHTSVLHWSHS
jgi:hypothetical protein